MASHPVNILSLCSGGAGFDLGLVIAEPRARVVCFVEREAFAASALVARMADEALRPAPVWDDVATFDGEPWRGRVDCVVAGFPCQPWSLAGRRRGTADERWLWPDILRIVREVAPPVVFLENVPGLLGQGLGEVLGDLAGVGFDAEWGVLGANEVGAPHLRRRVFILAYTDLGRWRTDAGDRLGGRQACDAKSPGEPGIGGGVLADAGCVGLDGMESQSVARRDPSPAAGSPGAGLADTDGSRDGQQEQPAPQWRWARDMWPPGPGETDRWRETLARAPGLAPATQPGLRRVADGMAAGLDEPIRTARLQLLGNGVVPLAAALAWKILLTRALAQGGAP